MEGPDPQPLLCRKPGVCHTTSSPWASSSSSVCYGREGWCRRQTWTCWLGRTPRVCSRPQGPGIP